MLPLASLHSYGRAGRHCFCGQRRPKMCPPCAFMVAPWHKVKEENILSVIVKQQELPCYILILLFFPKQFFLRMLPQIPSYCRNSPASTVGSRLGTFCCSFPTVTKVPNRHPGCWIGCHEYAQTDTRGQDARMSHFGMA